MSSRRHNIHTAETINDTHGSSTEYKRNKPQITLGEEELRTVNEIIAENNALIFYWTGKYRQKTDSREQYEELMQESVMAVYKLFEGKKKFSKEQALSTVKERIGSIIRDIALRLHAEYNRCISLNRLCGEDRETQEDSFDLPDEIHDDTFADRENQMFEQIAKKLSKKEMRLTELLYSGCSARQAAKRLKVSHTEVNKRIKKIREKLAGCLSSVAGRRSSV